MSEQIYPGPSQMVKIDGSRVRSLREAKGLTQLYIATVVEVTTDTISRWENKRYPSIKEENGLKLAEALEVTLDDILEKEEKTAKINLKLSNLNKGPNLKCALPQSTTLRPDSWHKILPTCRSKC